MRKRRQKSNRGHRKSISKSLRRSFFPWLVAVLVIIVALIGWCWISERQTTLQSEPKTVTSFGVVDQFYSQRPSFTDHLVEFLEEHDVTYKVHKDGEVTVDLYRNLPTFGYKIILLRVHAGISMGEEQETALFTSEKYNTDEYFVEQVLDQVGQGVLGAFEEPVFTVSPKFVTTCMEGNFQNAVVILSSCWGLHNTVLPKAFIEKGALTFVGWDERVELAHTDQAMLTLFEGLISEELTIKEAIDKVMREVGMDRVYGCTLKYYPYGNMRVSV